MFSSNLYSQRLGRIVFGVVLLFGAAVLVVRALSRGGDGQRLVIHADVVLGATWFAAFVAAALTRSLTWRIDGDAAALAKPGLIVPSVGIALVLPLTLHMPVVLLDGSSSAFDDWVRWSLAITCTAHLALALLVWHRASRLVEGTQAMSPLRIYTITVVVSAIPFVLLLAIPPMIVAVTGVVFLPLLGHMATIAEREHDADRAPQAVAHHVAA